MAAYTPVEAIELASRTGAKKGYMRPEAVFLSAISAGCLLSFASASFLIITTSPQLQEDAPGLLKMLGALIFPFGLVIITITGADLCTASFMYTTLAVLHRRLSLPRMLLHWVLTFWGNLAGALIVVILIFGAGGVFAKDPYRSHVAEFATGKQVTPEFHQVFLRGVGCNWLVALGLYLSLFSRDVVGKVVGLWWPVFAFVLCGMDHVVANMFFMPMALWIGETPGLTLGLYIWKGIVPALIGNIVGGSVFVAGYYWFVYLRNGQDDGSGVLVDGVGYQGTSSKRVGTDTSC
ncbi:putative formate/nitrite transporter [Microdochium trichocladiopsis]|uniref:Formate/nitrite transporter n=1 Tax=Microdochium trichocladiopsis TaxID=1682393 RepID=A0A9P8Y5J3_9PEZI|nr:putative formate/nitrite transporter [Microdochium trichocladiopsis]KAH7030731.1 putative formate/nitrite transporter [Microdochium trichocladiopsis]